MRSYYDDEFRATMIVCLQLEGYPYRRGALSKIARTHKIHRNTLRKWFIKKNPTDELIQAKKEEIGGLIEEEIRGILETMVSAKASASYKDLASALAVLIDKLRALEGQPPPKTRSTSNRLKQELQRQLGQLEG